MTRSERARLTPFTGGFCQVVTGQLGLRESLTGGPERGESVSKTGSSGTPFTGGFCQVDTYGATWTSGITYGCGPERGESVSKTGSSGTPFTGGFCQVVTCGATWTSGITYGVARSGARSVSKTGSSGTPVREASLGFKSSGFTPPDLRHHAFGHHLRGDRGRARFPLGEDGVGDSLHWELLQGSNPQALRRPTYVTTLGRVFLSGKTASGTPCTGSFSRVQILRLTPTLGLPRQTYVARWSKAL
jgi:hypothetical protein